MTGVLSERDAKALADDTQYYRWPSLNRFTATGVGEDMPVEILTDGINDMVCDKGCRDYPATQIEGQAANSRTLDAIFDPADAWRERLLSEGTPLDGDVRFSVTIQPKLGHSGEFFEWPLATPIEEYAVPVLPPEDEPEPLGSAWHLATGDEALALRALWAEARDNAIEGSLTEGWISIEGPDEIFYDVIVTDVLPYENEAGIVPRVFAD